MKFTSIFLAALVGLAGCGPADPIDNDGVDERVPYLEADPAYIDLYTPDVIIQPGEDKNLCVHLTYDGDDTGIVSLDADQSSIGHHLLLMTTDAPKTPGTLEDCDDPKVLRHLRPVMYPVPLPDDSGVRAVQLTKGMPLVLHFHNVNTKTHPVLVRDHARLEKVDPQDVVYWVSAAALADFDLKLGPRRETTAAFDCVVPRDLDLVLIGGHMHEFGKRFSVSNLAPLSLNLGSNPQTGARLPEDGPLYSVDEWEPDFRDTPTITPLFNEPRRLAKGSLLRVRCTWNNYTERWMNFPEEMCAVFGYVQEVAPEENGPGGSSVPLPGERFFCEAKSSSLEGAPL